MHSPDLTSSCLPSLSVQLKRQTDGFLCRIIRTNLSTQFAQTASELAEFCRAVTHLADATDDNTLSDMFRKMVHLTTYDSYAPFVARFSEKPCKASAVVNLLAPGLPDFLSSSSSTSGGVSKVFPKYNCLSKIRSSGAQSRSISGPVQRRTSAYIWYFRCDRMDIEDEDSGSVVTIYPTTGSVVNRRMAFNLDPERDGERMGTFILDHVAPYAAGFVRKWRSFLLIHVLFAAASRSLETMFMVFANTFVDMMRFLDVEFDMVTGCIENGNIPDLDGIEEVRQYLESNMSPDPERAAELRNLGRPSSSPGWCSRAWPGLRSVTTIASGSFASSVSLARWYLGSNAQIRAFGYGTAEGWIGSPYDPLKLDQFKPGNKTVIEFMDVDQSDESICALAQSWEVDAGKRYEIVITTPDGLWRYRLGDVVEIVGFDPTDGTPIIQFVERRNVVIRFPNFMVTERELRAAISSTAFNNVVDWTATIDNRCAPTTIGFFVELAIDQVSEPAALAAPDQVLDELLRSNARIALSFKNGVFRKPTIWLLRSGTFSAFRQLKLDEGNNSLGQVKVPVVLPKPAYVTWFLNRVVRELQ